MIKRFMTLIRAHLIFTQEDRSFCNWAKSMSTNPDEQSENDAPVVLLDCTHLSFTRWNLEHFLLLESLKQMKTVQIYGIEANEEIIWPSRQQKLLHFLKGVTGKDRKIAKSVFGIRNYIKFDYKKDHGECPSFSSKRDVLEFKYRDVVIGDLIYDTYLKWYRVPEVNLQDKKLKDLVAITIGLVDAIFEKLSTINISAIYLTHSVYIFYGCIARAALSINIPVYVTQNNRGKQLHKLTREHYFQTPDFQSYPEAFNNACNQKDLVAAAETALEKRFSGNIDSSISYMRVSAYESADAPMELNTDEVNVIIMLHCFFDSPHIYRSMLFPDFYDWFRYTASYCLSKGYNVYVKPHPNGLPGNEKVISILKEEFKAAHFLEPTVSNNTITNSGFDAAFTVHGTLGHEFPYLGTPVINAGSNPHETYNFCKTPQNLHQYRHLIDEIGFKDEEISKKEILKFYATHNLIETTGKNIYLSKYIHGKFKPKHNYSEMIASLTEKDMECLMRSTRKVLIAHEE